ncbi:hydantoinase/oxoprolinase family protein [Psychrobacter halodurans]|uniref:Hydantoinase/oxoprolinase family protein n=1 Tax=Psychrobacter halodurans TaxID=2818439 RepID=A0AAW4INX7_9GAMM|nr:hydantoinase/oxoprolinase family protein [Psychrobacter halodurans]MBO1516940.1 hydantoinase/oxoprolinase family protein [Psychrobacter halodurans]
MKNDFRIGVDAGGTFTDFVLAEKTGDVHLFKAPSTPEDGTLAIANGLQQIADQFDRPIEDIIQACDLCINGTTVALNALIQMKGVKVGLLCTAGHEDSIEIRLGHKEEGHRYDASYPPAPQIATRDCRLPIRGRILADGTEHEPLNEQDVLDAIKVLKEKDVKAVAISFVWSIRNTQHEQRAKQLIEQHMPGVFVCCGSDVYPQIKEYTRTSTTLVNAYLSPVMASYVHKIDDYFKALGAEQPVRYFQSNGGLAVGEIMRERAVNAINSGPASAPQAGLYIASPFGIDDIITVDMGGTSFDITMAKSGRTSLNRDIDFLRNRIGVPMIHVETLGAGGGSIGHVNTFGMLEVGPQSAGATPGPACYGKGGEQPTVTDANLVLGYLQPNAVLGGSVTLDKDKALQAVQTHIADPLKIDLAHAAFGISAIVNQNMSNAIRRITIEKGYDPRDFALVCAGGAGGMHIIALAEEMGIGTILIPKIASCLCAFGQIISDIKYNYLATQMMILAPEANLQGLNATLQGLEEEGVQKLLEDGFTDEDISIERTMEMRYVGQVHECNVLIPNGKLDAESVNTILESFHQRHKELYTYDERDSKVELVNIEVAVIGKISKPKLPTLAPQQGGISQAQIGHREMLFDQSYDWINTPIYDGEQFGAGAIVTGPALIQEPTTTVVIKDGWQAQLHETGTYKLTRAA